jgi:hypothetical protein
METMEMQLAVLRNQYNDQLSNNEEQFKKLKTEIAELRGKISAIDTLLGTNQTSGEPEIDLAATSPNEGNDIQPFTPVKSYWKPILRVLVEMGGRGRRQKVIQTVGMKMRGAGILTAADFGKLPKSNLIRWENRVPWQASEMRAIGLINSDSPRGIWEITDAGRKWLDDTNT